MKKILIIETTPAACALCGAVEELRPYGPEKKCICYECMKKDEKACQERCDKIFAEYDEIQIKEKKKVLALYRFKEPPQ